MDALLAVVVLVLFGVIAFHPARPKPQLPQIIYVRADLGDLKREGQGSGCLPLVVLVLVLLMAVALL